MRAISIAFSIMILMASVAHAEAEKYLEYYAEGKKALSRQKYDRAVKMFTKAIEDNPKFFYAYHSRAIAYSKKGEYEKSIGDLKQVVKLNPDSPDAYGAMGVVYEIVNDYRSAIQVYTEALNREKRPEFRKTLKKYIQDAKNKLKTQK